MQPEEVVARIKQKAKDKFKTGLNRAKGILEAVLSEAPAGLPLETRCLMTGFGGGGGLFGDTCGLWGVTEPFGENVEVLN